MTDSPERKEHEDVPVDHPDSIGIYALISGWAGTVPVEDFHTALKDNNIPEALWPSAPSDSKCL